MAHGGAFFLLLLVMFPCIVLSQYDSQELETQETNESRLAVEELENFLTKYGYLTSTIDWFGDNKIEDQDQPKMNYTEVRQAVKTFQFNYYLEPTGDLDPETVKLIKTPRCGVRDLFAEGKTRMRADQARYNAPSSSSLNTVSHYKFFQDSPRWNKTHITYAFYSELPNPIQYFDHPTLSPIIKRAFEKWSNVTSLTFEELQNGTNVDVCNADIYIAFHRLDHADGHPFHGPGTVLAHALRPPIGILHFDADEQWSATKPGVGQMDFESTAVHEIGHLLGIDHTSTRDAVMFPFLDREAIRRELADDDISGIKMLYCHA